MTRGMKTLKSKHHELVAWAVRFDGTMYCASVIRNETDLESDDVRREFNEIKDDLSVERIEICRSRRTRGGCRVTIGKPILVVMMDEYEVTEIGA